MPSQPLQLYHGENLKVATLPFLAGVSSGLWRPISSFPQVSLTVHGHHRLQAARPQHLARWERHLRQHPLQTWGVCPHRYHPGTAKLNVHCGAPLWWEYFSTLFVLYALETHGSRPAGKNMKGLRWGECRAACRLHNCTETCPIQRDLLNRYTRICQVLLK